MGINAIFALTLGIDRQAELFPEIVCVPEELADDFVAAYDVKDLSFLPDERTQVIVREIVDLIRSQAGEGESEKEFFHDLDSHCVWFTIQAL